MKKNFLFGLLAILLAGFWFGGASLAVDCDANTHEACINNEWYATLQSAIDAVTSDGWVITVMKDIADVKNLNFTYSLTIQAAEWNNITLTAAANDSNKNTVLWTVAEWKTVNFNGVKFDLSDVKYANAWYAAWFNLNGAGWNVWWVANAWKVEFENCEFLWRLTVVWEAEFDECTFNYDPTEAYQVEVRSRDSVSFSNCTFNGGDRNINIYDPTHSALSSSNSKITFSSCTFKAPNAVKKWAIVIHEQRDGSTLDKFNVEVTSATLNGTYPTTPHTDEPRAKMYSNGLIMVDDYNTTINTNWWDVVVTVDGSEVYSNPKKIDAGVVVAKIWESEYTTLATAIAEADDGATITLLSDITDVKDLSFNKSIRVKAAEWKEITIKAAANGSNKNTILWNVAEWKTVSFNGVKFDLSDVKYANAWYAAWFNLNGAGWNVWWVANAWKVEFENCEFLWRLTVVWEAEFDECTFNYDPTEAYQVEVRSRDSVSFSNCTFNGGDRNINIYDPTHSALSSSNSKITFSSCTFKAPNAVKKWAIVIHEQRDGSTLDKFNVEVTSATLNGTYPTTPHTDEPRAKMYGDGLIMIDDYNATIDTNWWDVVVTLDWSKVYSTPNIDNGSIVNHTVTFDGANDTVVPDWSNVAKPNPDPSKSCYHFDGWTTDGSTAYDFNSVVTADLALTSKWTYTCWWGGGSSKKTSTTDTKTTTWDNAKVDDKTTEDQNTTEDNSDTADGEDNSTNNVNVDENRYKDTDGDGTLDNGLTKELVDAYVFARENGITTMESPEEADMFGPLTRIAMAKMLSQYAINVLGKTPDTDKTISFPDVSAELDAEYNNGVTLAYQLGIMWINIEEFRPNDLVTRAEFGTALSRLLFGLADGEWAYYETHLQKLMDEKIITNDNPDLQELRGYVMIMLMRSAQ